jgi:hypothetical protein
MEKSLEKGLRKVILEEFGSLVKESNSLDYGRGIDMNKVIYFYNIIKNNEPIETVSEFDLFVKIFEETDHLNKILIKNTEYLKGNLAYDHRAARFIVNKIYNSLKHNKSTSQIKTWLFPMFAAVREDLIQQLIAYFTLFILQVSKGTTIQKCKNEKLPSRIMALQLSAEFFGIEKIILCIKKVRIERREREKIMSLIGDWGTPISQTALTESDSFDRIGVNDVVYLANKLKKLKPEEFHTLSKLDIKLLYNIFQQTNSLDSLLIKIGFFPVVVQSQGFLGSRIVHKIFNTIKKGKGFDEVMKFMIPIFESIDHDKIHILINQVTIFFGLKSYTNRSAQMFFRCAVSHLGYDKVYGILYDNSSVRGGSSGNEMALKYIETLK